MEDQGRSIDDAKMASIDMMTLNNKVVSMRPVVRRTRVQVINKLCRHINILKKKKGTEEHRAKNIRKAERLIEEIESLKRLKEDKVTKYALANTTSFNEVSKMSTDGGVRALARLADHPVMLKAVNDFRKKHSDWRDLAAYLLIKQTGRRFKTKKQKEKKKAFRLENINASETMTKAYIQERFGKEGVVSAERKFNRRKKKEKGDITTIEGDGPVEVMEEDLENKTSVKEIANKNKADSGKEQQEKEISKEVDVKKKENLEHDINEESICERKMGERNSNKNDMAEKQGNTRFEKVRKSNRKINNSLKEEEEKYNGNVDGGDDDDGNEKVYIEDEHDRNESQSIDIEDSSHSATEEDDTSSESELEKIQRAGRKKHNASSATDKLQVKGAHMTGKNKTDEKARKECVVKEFNMEEVDVIGDSEDADSDSISNNETFNSLINTKKLLNEEDESSTNEDENEENGFKKGDKNLVKKCKKESEIPDFLIHSDSHSTANFTSDLFLVGSDDEDEEEIPDLKNFERELSDEDNAFESQNSYCGQISRITDTDSLFLNSLGEEEERSRWNGNRRGSFEQRGKRRGGFRGRGEKFSADYRGKREFSGSRGHILKKPGRGAGVGDGSGQHLLDKEHRERRGGRYERSISRDKHQSNNSREDATASSYRLDNKDAPGEKSRSRQATSQSSEKLHPSWEASRKRKAEQSSGLFAFKGSKITFDDD